MDKYLIEARNAFLQLLPENRKGQAHSGGSDGDAAGGRSREIGCKSDDRSGPGVTDGDAGVGPAAAQLNKVDVMEIYSPPRVTIQAEKYGLRSGEAMDLATGYDFNDPEDRDKVWETLKRDEPSLVVGSPECRMFSGLQNLSGWSSHKQEELERARKHLAFVCQVYQYQMDNGRWFLHEHPSTATSWRESCVLKVMKKEGVATTIADQCMFGLQTWDKSGKPAIAKKKTRFMSNAEEILKAISRKCDGTHLHQPLLEGRAGPAAKYPPALCQAMCMGVSEAIAEQEDQDEVSADSQKRRHDNPHTSPGGES